MAVPPGAVTVDRIEDDLRSNEADFVRAGFGLLLAAAAQVVRMRRDPIVGNGRKPFATTLSVAAGE